MDRDLDRGKSMIDTRTRTLAAGASMALLAGAVGFAPVAAEDAAATTAAVLRLLGRIGERMTWAHVQKLRVIEGDE